MVPLTRRGLRAPAALTLFTTLALAAVACGGGVSPTPGGESAAPGQSSEPTETQAGPGESPGSSSGQSGATAFESATTALDALDSYTFNVEVQSTSVSGSVVTDTTHTVFSGIVVNKPDKASSLDMQDLDADGNLTSRTTIIIIGSQAWTSDNGLDGPWTEIPSSFADAFIQGMASFRPEQLFGLYFAGIGGDFHAVGSEAKNGVTATHYKGDEAIGALLAAIAGVQGSWTSDVWIANDGGFLVHSEASAEGVSGGEGGSFHIVVDITSPNASGPISPPS
jgi:hypothetical protein